MGRRRQNLLIVALVLGLLAASAIVIAAKPTVLGLDLRGGTQLVYEARPTPQTPDVTADAIDRAINIIRTRTDKFGVSEPEISRLGARGIQVGLPNVQNAQQAIDQIGTTAQLYFYDFEANIIPPPGNKNVPAGPAQLARPEPQRLRVPEPLRGGAVRLEAKADLPGQQVHRQRHHLLPVRPELTPAPCGASREDERPVPEVSEREAPAWQRDPRRAAGNPGGGGAVVAIAEPVHRGGLGVPSVRAQGSPGADRHRDHEPEAELRLADQPAQRHLRLQRHGPDRLPGRYEDDRPARERDRATGHRHLGRGRQLLPALRDRARQPGLLQPDHQLRRQPRRDRRAQGAQISGNFTISSAQDLATILQTGALPVKLALESQSTVSATLGSRRSTRASARAIGLVFVLAFLLLYYRLLGGGRRAGAGGLRACSSSRSSS